MVSSRGVGEYKSDDVVVKENVSSNLDVTYSSSSGYPNFQGYFESRRVYESHS